MKERKLRQPYTSANEKTRKTGGGTLGGERESGGEDGGGGGWEHRGGKSREGDAYEGGESF